MAIRRERKGRSRKGGGHTSSMPVRTHLHPSTPVRTCGGMLVCSSCRKVLVVVRVHVRALVHCLQLIESS